MRGDVSRRLGIIPEGVSWGGQSDQVFKNLAGDFMVDSIAAVDAVLEAGEPLRGPCQHPFISITLLGLISYLCMLEIHVVFNLG